MVMVEVDPQGDKGKELDEARAHRFLEKLGMTLTALEMRKALRDIDLNVDRKIGMSEYLLYRFKASGASIKRLVNATGSDNSQALKQGEALLNDAQQKLQSSVEAVRVLPTGFEVTIRSYQNGHVPTRQNLEKSRQSIQHARYVIITMGGVEKLPPPYLQSLMITTAAAGVPAGGIFNSFSRYAVSGSGRSARAHETNRSNEEL